MVIPALLGRTVAGEPRTRPGPVMAKARRLAHELEERRALVGLVRVRPAEGVLIPPGPGDVGGPGFGRYRGLSLCRSVPYVDQYVPLRWRVMAPTKKRPPYPRGCDGADKPEHNLVHHCFASERRRHWASLQALGTIRCRPPAGRAVIGFLRASAALDQMKM